MTSIEVAERLSERGTLDRDFILARFRGFVRRNYVTPAGLYVGDKKKAYLYGLPETFIGGVLSRLCDAGFNDSGVMLAASHALTSFAVEDFPDGPPFLHASPTTRAASPAAVVLDAYAVGARGWMLDVACFRHPDHPNPVSRARIRNQIIKGPNGEPTGTDFRPSEGFVLRSTHVVPLDDVLRALFDVAPRPGEAVH
ncbi:hypothetical protein JOD31_001510 [Methylopila capsulata]|nr:hypothetical protein [Methylopila capsulata]MBM7851285.1 hypothetical protein [Methylopila capsulata]